MNILLKYLDVFFLTLITGGITGFFLNINNINLVQLSNGVIFLLYFLVIIRLLLLKSLKINKYAMVISGVLLIYLFINVGFSELPSTSLGITIRVVLNILYAYFIYNRYSSSEMLSLLEKAFGIVIIGSFLVSTGLPNIGTYYDVVYSADVWRGMFTHKNTLGNMAAFYTLIIIINNKKWGLFKIAQLFIAIATLIFAESHTPLYILILCIIYVLIKKVTKKEFSNLIMGCVIGVNSILIFNYEIIGMILNEFGFDSTLSGRIDIYNIILRLIEENPYFGYGLKSSWNPDSMVYGTVYSYMGFNPNSAHNAFLESALGLGLIGMVIFLIIIISIFILGTINYKVKTFENRFMVLMVFLICVSTYESTIFTNLDQIYGLILFYLFFVLTDSKKSKSSNA